MIQFKQQLVHGTLIKRYKRFLADMELDDGNVVTAHCTNSGSMKSCLENGAEVYLTPVNDPKRKTKFTWEMIKINNDWVGINTSNPNIIAYNSIRDGLITELNGFSKIQREVRYGDSRFDIYCENENEKCFVEVKNVTLKEGDYALFPDAVTTRGLKHLNTLIKVKDAGFRAVMLYVIQRSDVKTFAPAAEIDPEYAKTLVIAHKSGVEIIPMQAKVTPNEIRLVQRLPFKL